MGKGFKLLQQPRWIAILAGLITFLYGYGFIFIGLDSFHVGLMAKPAIDILNGKGLFTGTYFYQGTTYPFLIAALFGIFGKSIVVLNIAGLLAYTVIAVFLILIWSRFIDYRGLWLSLILWVSHLPVNAWDFIAWNSIFALCTQVILLWTWLYFLENRKLVFCSLIVGILLSLVWGFRWTTGIATILGFLTYQLFLHFVKFSDRLSTKEWAHLIAGIILGFIPSLLYLWSTDAFLDWYRQTLEGKALWAAEYGVPIVSNPLILFGHYPELAATKFGIFLEHWIWKIIPLLALVFFALLLKRSFSGSQRNASLILAKELSVCAILLVSWHQYFPVPCTRHTFWAVSLGFFLPYYFGKLLLSHFQQTKYFKASIVITIPILGIFIYEASERILHGFKRIDASKEFISVVQPPFFAGLKLKEKQIDYFRKVEAATEILRSVDPRTKVIAYLSDPATFLASEKIETFHQVFFDRHDLAFRSYADFLPRLEEAVKGEKAFWLIDTPKYLERVQRIEPNLNSIAAIQNKVFIVYNPKLIPSSELGMIKERLRQLSNR